MRYYSDGWTNVTNPSDRGGWTVSTELITVEHTDIQGESLTNNQMELFGILSAMIEANIGDEIVTDSQFCWNTINGHYKVSKKNCLSAIFVLCKKVMDQKELTVTWEGRETNKAGMHNEALHQEPLKEKKKKKYKWLADI